MPTLGERVRIMRRRRGLTQKELADMAGVNKNTISRLEQGSIKDIGGAFVARIARALNISADYLLGMDESEESQYEPTAVA